MVAQRHSDLSSLNTLLHHAICEQASCKMSYLLQYCGVIDSGQSLRLFVEVPPSTIGLATSIMCLYRKKRICPPLSFSLSTTTVFNQSKPCESPKVAYSNRITLLIPLSRLKVNKRTCKEDERKLLLGYFDSG